MSTFSREGHCNAHGFTHLFYLLAKVDKFCIISQVNGKYLNAVSEVIGQGISRLHICILCDVVKKV